MAFIKVGKKVIALNLYNDGRIYMGKGFREAFEVTPRMSVYADKEGERLGVVFEEDGAYSTKGRMINTGYSLVVHLDSGRYIFDGQEGEMFVFKKEG